MRSKTHRYAGPRAAANLLIAAARRRGLPALTPMQILKLVYLAHGWNLAIHDRPLVQDSFQAWAYGPVVPSLYRAVRRWGSGPVEGPLPLDPGEDEEFPPEETEVAETVVKAYGALDGVRLSMLTHAEGTPWHEIYVGKGENAGDAPIPGALIREQFLDVARRSSHAPA